MKILVNLSALWKAAKEMEQSGAVIRQSGNHLSNSGSRAPSYDGQFSPWAQAIVSQANGRSKSIGGGVEALGFRVGRKADQFQAADTEALFGFSNLGAIRDRLLREYPLFGLFFRLSGLNRVDWKWGWLFPGFITIPWWIITRPAPGPWWWPRTPRFPRPVPMPGFQPKPSPGPSLPPVRLPDSFPKPVPVEQHPKPVPLVDTAPPSSNESCALYAQRRRPDLGPVGNSGNGNTGAGNYIHKYADKVFQTAPTDNLENEIATGHALVWEIGHPQANATYGHIAIVEEVHPDYVIVSQAGSPETRMKLSREYVSTLHVIP